MMRIKTGNPEALFNSVQYGFSQAVAARGSRLIAVSGQVAWNAEQELIGGDDLGAQTRAALENLRTALQSVDAGLGDVISLRIYVVDLEEQEPEAITSALQAFFPAERAPAATWIGVRSLANPALKVEIEATALAD
jgi:enamine deaminase RidA (YjgF/YER057c/UK114 family)